MYGIVGRNEACKSTLLGKMRNREFGAPNIKMHLVSQERLYSDLTIEEYFDLPVPGRLRSSSGSDECEDGCGIHESRSDAGRPVIIAREFGFTDLKTKIRDLGGGWRSKVRLVKAIYVNTDILLLDKPTNILDVETILRLEERLKRMKYAVIIVSHDRKSLDMCNFVLELHDGKISSYKGNYNAYEDSKISGRLKREKLHRMYVQESSRLEGIINSRLASNAKSAKMVQGKIRTLSRLEKVEIPKKKESHFRSNRR